jgi:hypothetical protein
VSVRTGFTPDGNLAETMPRASGFISTIPAVPPSAVDRFESVF